VTPSPSNLVVLAVLVVGCGSSEKSKERRELAKLEASLGMISSAANEDRPIRLEQLQNLRLETEKVRALKTLCTSSYESFGKASNLLAEATKRTGEVEVEIARFREKKLSGEETSIEEERRLLEMSAEAATTLKNVTDELDRAEALVASCDKKRAALKVELFTE
jgi:hypothetical protein